MDVVEQPCEYLGRKSSIQKELQGQEAVGEGSRWEGGLYRGVKLGQLHIIFCNTQHNEIST